MSSADPQIWVFPPSGSVTGSNAAGAGFGPISKGDSIELLWAPATARQGILLYHNEGWGNVQCAARNRPPLTVSLLAPSLDHGPFEGTTVPGSTSPLRYQLNISGPAGNGTIAWFAFDGAQSGNSVVFDYRFDRNVEGPTLWQQDSRLGAAPASTGKLSSLDASPASSIAPSSPLVGVTTSATPLPSDALPASSIAPSPAPVDATVSALSSSSTSSTSPILPSSSAVDPTASSRALSDSSATLVAAVVATVVATLAVALATIICLRRRRRRRRKRVEGRPRVDELDAGVDATGTETKTAQRQRERAAAAEVARIELERLEATPLGAARIEAERLEWKARKLRQELDSAERREIYTEPYAFELEAACASTRENIPEERRYPCRRETSIQKGDIYPEGRHHEEERWPWRRETCVKKRGIHEEGRHI